MASTSSPIASPIHTVPDGLAVLFGGAGHAGGGEADGRPEPHPHTVGHGHRRRLADDRPVGHAEQLDLHAAVVGHHAAREPVAGPGHRDDP